MTLHLPVDRRSAGHRRCGSPSSFGASAFPSPVPDTCGETAAFHNPIRSPVLPLRGCPRQLAPGVSLRASRSGVGRARTPLFGVTGGKAAGSIGRSSPMNNVNITGRVAKDPETRGTVTTLIVATDRVKLRDGKTYVDEATGYTAKETEFHKVTCFNGLGKAAASREKGNVVAITGRLHYSSWEDRDGVTRYGCEIIADKIDFF
jgi:single-strand DNA-binding protein